MRTAAAMLEGTHDMAAYRARGGDQMTSVRTIYSCSIEQRLGGADGPHGDASGDEDRASGRRCGDDGGFDVVVEGDGFLYKQVRIIAGTLVMVGMGLADPGLVSRAIANPEAAERGPVLPPEFLSLEHVEYEEDHPRTAQIAPT